MYLGFIFSYFMCEFKGGIFMFKVVNLKSL